MLQLNDVAIRAGSHQLFDGFSLTVASGEIVTLMGKSGCGKSTLLQWIAGTLLPAVHATGTICLNGTDLQQLPPYKRNVGMLFQDDLLFPHMSVIDNLLFAIPASVRGAQRQAMAMEALATIQLDHYANRATQQLSGGQKSRISLMRMLLSNPTVALLDEPFNALDSHLRQEIRNFVYAHIRHRQIPCIVVTHDAADQSERTILL